jgi:hypothetical protein
MFWRSPPTRSSAKSSRGGSARDIGTAPSREGSRDIVELLPPPVDRPSQKSLIEYKGFLYQAASWKTTRRVVAKVEHHAAERFPRVGFIVTNHLAEPGGGTVLQQARDLRAVD